MKWCVMFKANAVAVATAARSDELHRLRRRVFDTEDDAQIYAATVHRSRKPSIQELKYED
jgi:hypothetical protein